MQFGSVKNNLNEQVGFTPVTAGRMRTPMRQTRFKLHLFCADGSVLKIHKDNHD